MNIIFNVVSYEIFIISLCEKKMIEFEIYIYISSKGKWEYCDVILLLPLLGINHCQTLLHMSKCFLYE